jgi:choline dehydrogenase-like flavoprotein
MQPAAQTSDVIIIGSGMGGATLAAALAPTGRKVLILERGERLQDSPEARDPAAIFQRGHFKRAPPCTPATTLMSGAIPSFTARSSSATGPRIFALFAISRAPRPAGQSAMTRLNLTTRAQKNYTVYGVTSRTTLPSLRIRCLIPSRLSQMSQTSSTCAGPSPRRVYMCPHYPWVSISTLG